MNLSVFFHHFSYTKNQTNVLDPPFYLFLLGNFNYLLLLECRAWKRQAERFVWQLEVVKEGIFLSKAFVYTNAPPESPLLFCTVSLSCSFWRKSKYNRGCAFKILPSCVSFTSTENIMMITYVSLYLFLFLLFSITLWNWLAWPLMNVNVMRSAYKIPTKIFLLNRETKMYKHKPLNKHFP